MGRFRRVDVGGRHLVVGRILWRRRRCRCFGIGLVNVGRRGLIAHGTGFGRFCVQAVQFFRHLGVFGHTGAVRTRLIAVIQVFGRCVVERLGTAVQRVTIKRLFIKRLFGCGRVGEIVLGGRLAVVVDVFGEFVVFEAFDREVAAFDRFHDPRPLLEFSSNDL